MPTLKELREQEKRRDRIRKKRLEQYSDGQGGISNPLSYATTPADSQIAPNTYGIGSTGYYTTQYGASDPKTSLDPLAKETKALPTRQAQASPYAKGLEAEREAVNAQLQLSQDAAQRDYQEQLRQLEEAGDVAGFQALLARGVGQIGAASQRANRLASQVYNTERGITSQFANKVQNYKAQADIINKKINAQLAAQPDFINQFIEEKIDEKDNSITISDKNKTQLVERFANKPDELGQGVVNYWSSKVDKKKAKAIQDYFASGESKQQIAKLITEPGDLVFNKDDYEVAKYNKAIGELRSYTRDSDGRLNLDVTNSISRQDFEDARSALSKMVPDWVSKNFENGSNDPLGREMIANPNLVRDVLQKNMDNLVRNFQEGRLDARDLNAYKQELMNLKTDPVYSQSFLNKLLRNYVRTQ